MSSFSTEIIDGHIIVQINNLKYLIDTGSPVSFGNGGPISINGSKFEIPCTFFGLTIEKINQLSGLSVHGLIGMSILKQFDLYFTNTETMFTSLSSMSYSKEALIFPIIETIANTPAIYMKIGDENHLMYFDTGAKLSYLHEALLQRHISFGEVNDFHPSIGNYTVPVYKVRVNIGEKQEDLVFGRLPSSLSYCLDIPKVKGILGTEPLKNYSIILSNSTKKLIFEPNEL